MKKTRVLYLNLMANIQLYYGHKINILTQFIYILGNGINNQI